VIIISDIEFKDINNNKIRLTNEPLSHIEEFHPEIVGQTSKIQETLLNPDIIIRAPSDSSVQLFYRNYDLTPVTKKYLCVVVKEILDNNFIITVYFTNTIKKGASLWEKK